MKRENEMKLGDALKLTLKDLGIEEKFKSGGVEDVWNKVMGETVAGYTDKVYVRRKVLWVKLNSAALKQELTYGRKKIIEHLNQEMGEDFIEDIRFS